VTFAAFASSGANAVRIAASLGSPNLQAYLSSVIGLAVDRAGNLFIATGDRDQRVRRIDSTGVIRTIAGDGTTGYEGDGGPATAARLSISAGRGGGARLAVDGAGNLFIARSRYQRPRWHPQSDSEGNDLDVRDVAVEKRALVRQH
jgi:hypothetical protein